MAFNVLTPPAVAASGVIVKREKLEDGTWKLSFNSPLKVNYHDGLAVACSTPGTNGISKDYKLNGEWIPVEYSFKGFELMRDDPGVVFGRVFLDAQEFSLKDFSIEVKKQ